MEPTQVTTQNSPEPKLIKTNSKRLLKTLLVILGVTFLGLGGFILYSQQQKLTDKSQQIVALTSEITSLHQSITTPIIAEETIAEQDTDPAIETTVVFSPDLFSDAQKNEIQKKLIKPMIAYETSRGSAPVSIHVQFRLVNSTETDFIVDVIYSDGGHSGFLYGDNTAVQQPWFSPGCIDVCGFSDEFIAAYPEIAEKAQ